MFVSQSEVRRTAGRADSEVFGSVWRVTGCYARQTKLGRVNVCLVHAGGVSSPPVHPGFISKFQPVYIIVFK